MLVDALFSLFGWLNFSVRSRHAKCVFNLVLDGMVHLFDVPLYDLLIRVLVLQVLNFVECLHLVMVADIGHTLQHTVLLHQLLF